MPIDEYLMDGEDIMARAGDYYATDKRVIRYKKRLVGEELDDLPYAHITSLSIVTHPRAGLTGGGIFLLALGIIGVIVNIFADIGVFGPLAVVGIILGIILIALGIIFPTSYVQLRALGINQDAEEKLRLTKVSSEDTKKFILLVREHM